MGESRNTKNGPHTNWDIGPLRGIIYAVSGHEDASERLISAFDGDFHRLLLSAKATRTLPLVGAFVMNHLDFGPEWFRETSLNAYQESNCKRDVLLLAAQEIANEFNSAGVPLAIRKGLHVSSLYRYPATRPIGDIDIYISPSRAPVARNLLQELGFSDAAVSRQQLLFRQMYTSVLAVMHHSSRRNGHKISVDLHGDLVISGRHRQASSTRVSRMLEHSQVLNGLPVLSPTDLVIDLAVNLVFGSTDLVYARDRCFQKLTLFSDVALACRDLNVDQWSTLDEVVNEYGVREVVTRAFSMTAHVLPDLVTDNLRCRALEVDVSEWDVVDSGKGNSPDYVWRIPLMERLALRELPHDFPHARTPF